MTKTKTFRTAVAALILACTCAVVQAETPLAIAGFPNARAVYHTDIDTDDYLLSLGALKKVNNVWLAEQEQRISGQLHRQTLELPAGFNATEAYRHFAEQLDGMNTRELFSCRGRRCGSSNSWANNRFGVKQLYGLDQHQHYGAFEIVDGRQQLYFVVLYTVQRGNRRVYAQLDVLRSRSVQQGVIAASPDTIVQLLQEDGYYVLPGFSAGGAGMQQEEQHLQAVAAALRKQRMLRVALVGHDYGPGQQRQETSLGYAQYIRDRLVQAGIDTKRLEVHGLGALAPGRRAERSVRVEIVRLDR